MCRNVKNVGAMKMGKVIIRLVGFYFRNSVHDISKRRMRYQSPEYFMERCKGNI